MSGLFRRLEEKAEEIMNKKFDALMPAVDQLHNDLTILNKNVEKLNENFLKLIKSMEGKKSGG